MQTFAILGDPVRRRILEHLCIQDMSSGEVVSTVGVEFGISQSAISQHLKILRENSLATVQIDGARRIYSLDPEGLEEMDQWLAPFRQFWEPKFAALETEVARGKKNKNKNRN